MPNRAGPISRGSLRCRVGSERRQKPAVHSNALGDIIIKPVKTPTGLRVRKSYHVAFHMGTRCPQGAAPVLILIISNSQRFFTICDLPLLSSYLFLQESYIGLLHQCFYQPITVYFFTPAMCQAPCCGGSKGQQSNIYLSRFVFFFFLSILSPSLSVSLILVNTEKPQIIKSLQNCSLLFWMS